MATRPAARSMALEGGIACWSRAGTGSGRRRSRLSERYLRTGLRAPSQSLTSTGTGKENDPAWCLASVSGAASSVSRYLLGPGGAMELAGVLREAMSLGASDVHLKARQYPVLRVRGHLMRLENWPLLDAKDLE